MKRYLKFYKDPFAEYFRLGCHCWIPLDKRPMVDFKFIEKTNEELMGEIDEREKYLENYFENKVVNGLKRKKKSLIWKGKMKKIAVEKLSKKNEKEKKKLLKMTETQKEKYKENIRKEVEKKKRHFEEKNGCQKSSSGVGVQKGP